jgi:FeS assembly protein IscX
MALKWTDVNDIAIELFDSHPDVDPLSIRFTDLHKWVMAIEDFDDDPNKSSERILEAIQAAWIEEVE